MNEDKKAVLIQFPSERMARDFLGETEFKKSVTARIFSEKELAGFYIDIAKIRGEVVRKPNLPNETGLAMAIQGIEYASECLSMVLSEITLDETKKRTPK